MFMRFLMTATAALLSGFLPLLLVGCADVEGGGTSETATSEVTSEPPAWTQFLPADAVAAFVLKPSPLFSSSDARTLSTAAFLRDAEARYGFHLTKAETAVLVLNEAELDQPVFAGAIFVFEEPTDFSPYIKKALEDTRSVIYAEHECEIGIIKLEPKDPKSDTRDHAAFCAFNETTLLYASSEQGLQRLLEAGANAELTQQCAKIAAESEAAFVCLPAAFAVRSAAFLRDIVDHAAPRFERLQFVADQMAAARLEWRCTGPVALEVTLQMASNATADTLQELAFVGREWAAELQGGNDEAGSSTNAVVRKFAAELLGGIRVTKQLDGEVQLACRRSPATMAALGAAGSQLAQNVSRRLKGNSVGDSYFRGLTESERVSVSQLSGDSGSGTGLGFGQGFTFGGGKTAGGGTVAGGRPTRPTTRVIPRTSPTTPPATSRPSPPVATGSPFAFSLLSKEQVTAYCTSEDGRLVFTAHQTTSEVAVWDITDGRKLGSLRIANPNALLFRENCLYVLLDGTAQNAMIAANPILDDKSASLVSVVKYAPGKGLVQSAELGSSVPGGYQLSAAFGQGFKGNVFVIGQDSSRRYTTLGAVNLQRPNNPALFFTGRQLATVTLESHGQYVLFHESTTTPLSLQVRKVMQPELEKNFSETRANSYSTYSTGTSVGTVDSQLYQPRQTSWWFSRDNVHNAANFQPAGQFKCDLVAVDLAQDVFYTFDQTTLSARDLDVAMSVHGHRPTTSLPPLTKRLGTGGTSGRTTYRYGVAGTVLATPLSRCHPVAVTIGDKTYFIVHSPGTSAVWRGVGEAFVETADLFGTAGTSRPPGATRSPLEPAPAPVKRSASPPSTGSEVPMKPPAASGPTAKELADAQRQLATAKGFYDDGNYDAARRWLLKITTEKSLQGTPIAKEAAALIKSCERRKI